MTAILWTGAIVGALLGVTHAVYVYRLVKAEPPAFTSSPLVPAYYALWTVGLWTLFGSYVLLLWLVGIVFYTLFRAFR